MSETDPESQKTIPMNSAGAESANQKEFFVRLENFLNRTIGRLFALSQGNFVLQGLATQYMTQQEGWTQGKIFGESSADERQDVRTHVVDRLTITTLSLIKGQQHTHDVFRGYSRAMEGLPTTILLGLIQEHTEKESRKQKEGGHNLSFATPTTVKEATEALFGKPEDFTDNKQRKELYQNIVDNFVTFVRGTCAGEYDKFTKFSIAEDGVAPGVQLDTILKGMMGRDLDFQMSEGRPAAGIRVSGDSGPHGKDFSYVVEHVIKRKSADETRADPFTRMFDAIRSRLVRHFHLYAPIIPDLLALVRENLDKSLSSIVKGHDFTLLIQKLRSMPETQRVSKNSDEEFSREIELLLRALKLADDYNVRHEGDADHVPLDLSAWAVSYGSRENEG